MKKIVVLIMLPDLYYNHLVGWNVISLQKTIHIAFSDSMPHTTTGEFDIVA